MGKLIRNAVATADLLKFDVAEDGIYKPVIQGSGNVYLKMLIPREVFVEAYNKYIVEENNKKEENE